MKNLSLLVVAALGLFAVGCKSDPVHQTGATNLSPDALFATNGNTPSQDPKNQLNGPNKMPEPGPGQNQPNNPMPGQDQPIQPNNPMPGQDQPIQPYPTPSVTPIQPTPDGPNVPQNQGTGIAGTWKPDVNTFAMSLPQGQTPDQEKLMQAVQMIKQQLSASSVTFNADGTYTSVGAGSNGSGRYQMNGGNIQMQENNPQGPMPSLSMGQGGNLHMHVEMQGGVTMDCDLVRA